VLAIGICSAAFLIYRALALLVEDAAFSSHISLVSTGELFWNVILKVNLYAVSIILVVGLLIIVSTHIYLQFFFHTLANGLDRLAKGDYSFRLRKGKWLGGRLIEEFNKAVMAMENASAKAKKLIDSSITNIETLCPEQKQSLEEIKSIHNKLRRDLI